MDVIQHPRSMPFSPDGNLCHRTPASHPYSYDPFVVWTANAPPENSSVYTDRLRSQRPDEYKALAKELFPNLGDYWSEYPPIGVQAFLRRLLDCQELEVCRLIEHCNWSNGYPCWQILYHDPRKVS